NGPPTRLPLSLAYPLPPELPCMSDADAEMTEKGFSPPQAAGFPTQAVRRSGFSPPVRWYFHVCLLVRAGVLGHVAPSQPHTVGRCRGNAFPRGKAVTCRGPGALRLSGGLRAPHAPPRWRHRPVGGGTASEAPSRREGGSHPARRLV